VNWLHGAPGSTPSRGARLRHSVGRLLPQPLRRFGLTSAFLSCAACNTWSGGPIYIAPRQPVWRAQHQAATFKVGLPGSDWTSHREQGTQVAWRNKSMPIMMQVRSQCQEHGDSDLESLTDHLRIDWTGWTVLEERLIELVDRDALRSTVEGKLDGVSMKAELIVIKKDGCIFDLDYFAPTRYFDAGLPAFEKVVEGFRFPIRR
jgi:hypothetical protein